MGEHSVKGVFKAGAHIQDIQSISLQRLERETSPEVKEYARRKPYSEKPIALKKLSARKKDESE